MRFTRYWFWESAVLLEPHDLRQYEWWRTWPLLSFMQKKCVVVYKTYGGAHRTQQCEDATKSMKGRLSFTTLGCSFRRNMRRLITRLSSSSRGWGGGYRHYWHPFGLDNSPNCHRCGGIPQDPGHVMFQCPTFTMKKGNLSQGLGKGWSGRFFQRFSMSLYEKNWKKKEGLVCQHGNHDSPQEVNLIESPIPARLFAADLLMEISYWL